MTLRNPKNRRNITANKSATRRAVRAVVFHVLFLIVVYLVQALVLPYLSLPATPLLLPLAAVGAAMGQGGTRGAAMGLIAGALCDISFLRPVAGFTLLLTVLCLVIGVLSDTVIARGLLSYLVLCLFTLVVCAAAQMFQLLVFVGVPPRALFAVAGRQTLMSLPFALVLYPISRVVYKTDKDS
ncbi:MAG: hypothetical protein LBN02_00840 [Oscillospiraceae bacterium]|jgi:hypothetical protein|nr:hypothetical protein [Oscillospiraceae bacterium]